MLYNCDHSQIWTLVWSKILTALSNLNRVVPSLSHAQSFSSSCVINSIANEELDLDEAAGMTLDDNNSDEAESSAEPATAEDMKFMKLAQETAMNSKDTQTKVGLPTV